MLHFPTKYKFHPYYNTISQPQAVVHILRRYQIKWSTLQTLQYSQAKLQLLFLDKLKIQAVSPPPPLLASTLLETITRWMSYLYRLPLLQLEPA